MTNPRHASRVSSLAAARVPVWPVVRVEMAACPRSHLAIAPIFRPGSTAQEVRWSVNSEGIRYLVGARQFPRLRLRAPEHRCYLDAAWTVMPCGAARVVIDASFGGPHTACTAARF